jgi:hypothetical protein
VFLAVVAIVSGGALVQACSASGGEAGDDSSQAGNDASSGGDAQTIDSPIAIDTGVQVGDSGSDTGVDSGPACVLTPPSNKCGIFPNCGCAGTTCDFVLDSGMTIEPTACTPSVGTATGGMPCTVTTDCAQGLTCVNGLCHEFCGSPGDPCTGIYSDCRNHNMTNAFNICGIRCNPTNATSCNGGEGCVAVAAGSSLVTSDCEPVGSKTLGHSCANALDCAPGLNCVTTGSMSCKQWCTVGSMCSGTVACAPYGTPITIDGTEYGYCP